MPCPSSCNAAAISRAKLCAAPSVMVSSRASFFLRRGENVPLGGEARDQPGLLFKPAHRLLGAADDVPHALPGNALALRDLGKREVFVVMQVKVLALLFGEQLAVRVKEHRAKSASSILSASLCQGFFPCHRHIIPVQSEPVKVFSLTAGRKRISHAASGKMFRKCHALEAETMETVVIALEELAHYAESTARTMPVTGVVPRAVAKDQIRHALRALRESAGGWMRPRRTAERGGCSTTLAVRAGGSLRARRVPCRRTASHHMRGALVPALCRCCSRPAAGAWTRKGSPYFWKAFSGKHRSPGASWPFSARRCARRSLVRLAQLYRGDALRRVGRRVFYSAAAHRLARPRRGAGRGRRRGAHPPARPGGGVPAHGRAQPPGTTARALKRFRGGKIKSEARVAEEALRLAERADGVRRRHRLLAL